MNTHTIETRICGCCKRGLPTDSFYYNKRKRLYDNYCKECRKACSSRQRKLGKQTKQEKSYPVITEVKDTYMRQKLIMHSLAQIRESIRRKQEKKKEAELRLFERIETV